MENIKLAAFLKLIKNTFELANLCMCNAAAGKFSSLEEVWTLLEWKFYMNSHRKNTKERCCCGRAKCKRCHPTVTKFVTFVGHSN